jgi:hypothetical protein
MSHVLQTNKLSILNITAFFGLNKVTSCRISTVTHNFLSSFTQPLTEINTRSRKIIFLGSKVQLVHRADDLATICEPIVWTMWNP